MLGYAVFIPENRISRKAQVLAAFETEETQCSGLYYPFLCKIG